MAPVSLSLLQDKSVAFKIFELGLKKYGDIPEYILAYIDYLSHLNGKIWGVLHLYIMSNYLYITDLSSALFPRTCCQNKRQQIFVGTNPVTGYIS